MLVWDKSLFLLYSLYSVCILNSCGIVRAFVDFKAKNLGGAGPGAFLALNCIFYCNSDSVCTYKTSLVLLELDLDKGNGLESVVVLLF